MGCTWISAPPQTLQAAGAQLLHCGLQGNLSFGSWSTSFPSFLADLGVCRTVSHIFSLLSSPAAILPLCSNFFPFFTLISQRDFHHQWWTQPCPARGPSWSWHCLYWTQRKLLAASQRSNPCSPPVTKTWQHTPNALLTWRRAVPSFLLACHSHVSLCAPG